VRPEARLGERADRCAQLVVSREADLGAQPTLPRTAGRLARPRPGAGAARRGGLTMGPMGGASTIAVGRAGGDGMVRIGNDRSFGLRSVVGSAWAS
jgi:hypothetical protein